MVTPYSYLELTSSSRRRTPARSRSSDCRSSSGRRRARCSRCAATTSGSTGPATSSAGAGDGVEIHLPRFQPRSTLPLAACLWAQEQADCGRSNTRCTRPSSARARTSPRTGRSPARPRGPGSSRTPRSPPRTIRALLADRRDPVEAEAAGAGESLRCSPRAARATGGWAAWSASARASRSCRDRPSRGRTRRSGAPRARARAPHQLGAARDVGLGEVAVERLPVAPDRDQASMSALVLEQGGDALRRAASAAFPSSSRVRSRSAAAVMSASKSMLWRSSLDHVALGRHQPFDEEAGRAVVDQHLSGSTAQWMR